MTTSTDKILNTIEIIKHAEATLEIIENTRSKVYNELIDTIHRLSYDECMMLIDKSHDMPEKIFDEILKRARYLGGVRRMIAIEGLEMPENCSGCDLCRGHICKITGTDIVTNPKGNCPLVEDVVEREKIDKAIKIAKDTISECFELGLDDRAYGMREILNIFEENIGERIEILHKLEKE